MFCGVIASWKLASLTLLFKDLQQVSFNLLSVVWVHLLEYIKGIVTKSVDQQLYVVFGPVFDYDADGLADTNFTTAR